MTGNHILMPMSNPYESSELPAAKRSRWAWVRWVLAAPFLFSGVIWTLTLIRTGGVVMEAMSRYAETGRDAVVGDSGFSELLWHVTVFPATGLGALLIGYSIIKGNRVLGLAGAVWMIVALFGVDALLQWLLA